MNIRRVAAAAFVMLAVSGALTHAQTIAGATDAIYRLGQKSTFEDGCFDPCLCPAHTTGGLIGTFRMTPGAPDPLYQVFNISDLNWFVPEVGYWVTGSGTYKVGGEFALTQELALDLKVADRDVQHYDSGLVAGGAGFPAIDVTVSMNNMVCHDTVFHVVAAPVLPQEIAPYMLYGSAKLEGCFGPCECVVTSHPVSGRFGLVRIDGGTSATGPVAGGTTADFGVVNIAWLQRDNPTIPWSSATPVTGAGLYHVDLAAAGQRMRLALVENGVGPTRYDSGPMPWKGDLRKIDIEAAENGFACYDEVFSIHARRRSTAASIFELISPEPIRPGVTPVP